MELDLSKILDRILSFQPDGLIVHLEPSNIISLISEIEKKEYPLPIFIALDSRIKYEFTMKKLNMLILNM